MVCLLQREVFVVGGDDYIYVGNLWDSLDKPDAQSYLYICTVARVGIPPQNK